jgi:CRP-like cAMP-binding protein
MSNSAQPQNPLENHLLAALPKEVYESLLPQLEPVSFSLGEVIYESGEQMTQVYFPTTSIVSLLYLMTNGATAEIGVVGFEGMLGIAIFLGGDTTPNRAVVQSAGHAYKMDVQALRDKFEIGGPLQLLLLRYTQALITQISQTAVCNRLHSVEQQLCRWLLLSHDRLRSDKLVMTQDLISNMLGVRREGVTMAAQHLKDRELISYVRGTITVRNRLGLEAAVCECYQVVKTEYDRLLN